MEYRICTRCIMDTSDPSITFDEEGRCNHCTETLERKEKVWIRDQGFTLFEKMMDSVKKQGAKNKKYDCIIGISGGIDSSYLAYLCAKYNVRMLGVHIDAGWNTEVSNRNIRNLCAELKIDLVTVKIDEREMNDLQRAYFLSGVINQDVPQDHAFFAALYDYAIKNKIKTFLGGGNFSSESILPRSWIFDSGDSTNLKAIHKKYGSVKLNHYPLMSFYKFYIHYPIIKRLKRLKPLDLIDYDKEKAINELHEKLGFEYYGSKHCESIFTRLYQSYILPVKFGIDKRRCHLSSLIVADQLTRKDALKILEAPLCTKEQIENDICFFTEKIGISRETFNQVISQKPVSHLDFKNNSNKQKFKNIVKKIIRR